MRICVELGLHRQHSMDLVTNPGEKQRRLIVFWESYSLDRLSSSTLGRPFAIEDSAIDLNLTDEILNQPANSGGIDQSPYQTYIGIPTHSNKTVFMHLSRLDHITSNICRSIRHVHRTAGSYSVLDSYPGASGRSLSRAGHIFTSVRIYSDRLDEWRGNIPIFQYPGCAYETKEFFELSFQESKFHLLRAAINSLSSSVSSPPDALLRPCVKSACQVIVLFDGLRQNSLIGISRVYAYTIFIVSLWLIFSIYVRTCPKGETRESTSEPDLHVWLAQPDEGEQDTPNLNSILDTLALSNDILMWFADQMSDIAIYAKFINVLKRELEIIVSTTQSSHGACDQSSLRNNIHDRGYGDPTGHTMASAYYTLDILDKDPRQELNLDTLLEASSDAHGQTFNPDNSTYSLLSGIFDNEHHQSVTADYPPGRSLPWSLSNVPWMDEIDYGLSGCIWDTINLNPA